MSSGSERDKKPNIKGSERDEKPKIKEEDEEKPTSMAWWEIQDKKEMIEQEDVKHWSRFWSYVPSEPTKEEIFWTIRPGRSFRGYEDLPVEVQGPAPNKYQPIKSFHNSGLAADVLRNIEELKYCQPTPVQQYALPIIQDDRDLLAVAQTGSGKTAAYLLPLATKLVDMKGLPLGCDVPSPLALILVPTRELARQVYVDAKAYTWETDIQVVRLYGDVDRDHQVQKLNSKRGCHVVIATPGGLKRLLSPQTGEPQAISLAKVMYLVFDEADHMIEIQRKVLQEDDQDAESDFYHQIKRIMTNYDMPHKDDRQTVMFSATFPKKVQTYAMEFMNDRYLSLLVGKSPEGSSFKDIKQTVVEVQAKDKRNKLLEILQAEMDKRVIVFVRTKRRLKDMVNFLKKSNLSVAALHSDRVQRQRELALKAFRGKKDVKQSFVPIIVATAVGSRGLDIEGVELVINFDLPDAEYVSIEEYIHKIGRTGRIGNSGRAISFFDPMNDNDKKYSRPLVKALVDSQQEVPNWLDKIAYHAVGTKNMFNEKTKSRDIRYIGKINNSGN